jgi:hypothetical protein
MTDLPRRLPPAAAGEYLGGISEHTMAHWRCKGGGPRFIDTGRRIFYDVADLDAWLETKKRSSTSDRGPAPKRRGRPPKAKTEASTAANG